MLVVGEAKRGKSTVVNALLGRRLLPTGVVPVTAVATTIAYGAAPTATVHYQGGRSEPVALERLSEFVTTGNPGNVRSVDSVAVHVPASLLADGVELVDTPGTGSVHEHNTTAASAALTQMDAAVFVLSADPPVSAAERLWLRQVRDQAVRVFCVLNKADHLTTDELAQSVAFTRQVLAGELGADVTVWPVSARRALAAGQDGSDPDAPQLDNAQLDNAKLDHRSPTSSSRSGAATVSTRLPPAQPETSSRPAGDRAGTPSRAGGRSATPSPVYLRERRLEDLARSDTRRAAPARRRGRRAGQRDAGRAAAVG